MSLGEYKTNTNIIQQDDFSSTLDTSKWNVENGTVVTSSGSLKVGSTSNQQSRVSSYFSIDPSKKSKVIFYGVSIPRANLSIHSFGFNGNLYFYNIWSGSANWILKNGSSEVDTGIATGSTTHDIIFEFTGVSSYCNVYIDNVLVSTGASGITSNQVLIYCYDANDYIYCDKIEYVIGNTKILLNMNGNSNDTSGYANNGSDTSITYSQANGKFNQGAGFNGTSSKIDLGNAKSIQITHEMTLSAWIMIKDTGHYGGLVSKIDNWSTFLKGYGFRVNNTNVLLGVSTTDTLYGANVAIPDTDKYHLYTMTYKPSGDLKFFIDGKMFNSTTGPSAIYNSATNLILGRSTGDATNQYSECAIDEVVLEDRAWTDSEVKKYYTFTKGRFGTM